MEDTTKKNTTKKCKCGHEKDRHYGYTIIEKDRFGPSCLLCPCLKYQKSK